MTPEGKIKKQIKDYLKTLAPHCWFFCPQGGPYGRAGIPDIVGCYRGFFFAVEVKAAGKAKELTKLQQLQLYGIHNAGAYGIATDCIQDVKTLIVHFDGDTRF